MTFSDEGISGRQLKKRDEFMRMLNDAEDDSFDVVVVKDVSRFSRNTVDLLTSIRSLRARGINVLFVNNNQQTLGESEFVITLLGAVAQEESANLSKRVQFGKDVTARRGRVPKTILGYDYIDNYTLKVNEQEAALVRRIYSMYLSGSYGMAGIAAELRGEKILTKLGCDYTESYIRRILTNTIYCGDMVNHKTQVADFINGIRKNVPDEEQYHHDRPELAIISREDFGEVQQIREKRCRMQIMQGSDPRRRYTSRYLFSGLVRCSECGCMMNRQNVTRKDYNRVDGYWRCKNGTRLRNSSQCNNRFYVPDNRLKKGLSEALERCIQDKDTFAQEVQEQMKLQKEQERPIEESMAEKQRAIEKLLKQKQKYIDMYTNDILSMDELKVQTDKIGRQMEALHQKLAILSRDAKSVKCDQRNIAECIAEIESFLHLENVNNAALRKILSHVEAKPDKTLSFIFKIR